MPGPNQPRSRDQGRRTVRAAGAVLVDELRRELHARPERTRQALLHYEIAHVLETECDDRSEALREYLAAYNLLPAFRPPLFALIRLIESQGSTKNLDRLYAAQVKAATTGRESAEALTDSAWVLHEKGDRSGARAALIEAMKSDPGNVSAALMLEYDARMRGDEPSAEQALAQRANSVGDPVLRALLWAEQAHADEAAGDVDRALETLQRAADAGAAHRMLEATERLGWMHGRWLAGAAALDRLDDIVLRAQAPEPSDHSGPYHLERIEDDAAAVRAAVAMRWEAARLYSKASDDAAAIERLKRAADLRPNDIALEFDRMRAAERAEDLDEVARIAEALLAEDPPPRFATALHFQLAEVAQARGDKAACQRALERARDAMPSGFAAAAMLDDVLAETGDVRARVENLLRRADGADAAIHPERWRWRAAELAAIELGDFAAAKDIYAQILHEGHAARRIHREAAALAELRGDAVAAIEARSRLLALEPDELDEDERDAIAHAQYRALARDENDSALGEAFLFERLNDERHPWVADEACIRGARSTNYSLLAAAHRSLAGTSGHAEAAAARFCAAGRAEYVGGDGDAAAVMFRRALEASPGHPYALAALTDLLKTAADQTALLDVLREHSRPAAGTNNLAILVAAATAEAQGDFELAIQSYEDASDREPGSITPLLSLKRVARTIKDDELEARIDAALSERELATGKPGRSTFDVAERLLRSTEPQRAEAPLRTLLTDPDLGCDAAIACLGPHVSAESRANALSLLYGSAESADRHLFERVDDALGTAWTTALEEILRGETSALDVRAEAWLTLGRLSHDPALLLTSLRARRLARGPESSDDAFLLASEIAELDPESPAAAVALDESLSAGDDVEEFTRALTARTAQIGREGRATTLAARARAELATGKHEEALNSFMQLVEENDHDYSSWEALRAAAHRQQRFDLVVRACDRLAQVLGDGREKSLLLEEAGAALMDYLDDDESAIDRFRRAIASYPQTEIAYLRLHDLLAERSDDQGLLKLIEQRLPYEDRSDVLEKLLYERARLFRSTGHREDALEALDGLFTLNELHAGGLALAAEIFVSLEDYEGAVETMQLLATADVPNHQKRVARLGAALFLETKLDRIPDAIRELERILASGLGDEDLALRIVSLTERVSDHEKRARAYRAAAELASSDARRAAHSRQAAKIFRDHLDAPDEAIAQCRRALEADPGDEEALAILLSMTTESTNVDDVMANFENSAHAALDADPANPRPLLALARLRGDLSLEHAALSLLLAVDLADPMEQKRFEEIHRRPPLPHAKLKLSELGYDPNDPWNELAALLAVDLLALDQRSPGGLQLGKKDLVATNPPSPLREDVARIARTFSIELGALYVDSRNPEMIAAGPESSGTVFVALGSGIGSPLTARDRFVIGEKLIAIRCGFLGLIERDPDEAAAVLVAATHAASSPAGQIIHDELAAWSRTWTRTLSRKAKRDIATLAPRLNAAGTALEACYRFRTLADRAGLISAWDIKAALQNVLAAEPTADAVRNSSDAHSLIQFWMSNEAHRMAAELELAP